MVNLGILTRDVFFAADQIDHKSVWFLQRPLITRHYYMDHLAIWSLRDRNNQLPFSTPIRQSAVSPASDKGSYVARIA